MRQTQITLFVTDANGQTRVDIQGGSRMVDTQGNASPVEVPLPELVAEAMRALALLVREMRPKEDGPKLMVARGIPAMN